MWVVTGLSYPALVDGVVPDSPKVKALLDTLDAQFLALEVDQFLVRPAGP